MPCINIGDSGMLFNSNSADLSVVEMEYTPLVTTNRLKVNISEEDSSACLLFINAGIVGISLVS